MTTEQKAKAYDEALGRAKVFKKHLLEINDNGYADEMDYIFPELKKSEGESIRKAIIEFFELQDDNTTYSLVPKKDILAWLEKQGDTNHQSWKPSKGQISALEHFVRSIEESGFASPYDNNTKLLNSLINDLYKLKKQGEQKETLCDKCKKDQSSHSCQDITELGRCYLEHEKQGEQKSFDYENANIQQKDFAQKVEPKFHEGEWITIKQ